jgi:glycosyltransferase involved in cell wall biosynthesis
MSQKLLIINSVLGYSSTGRIVLDLAKKYDQNGFEVKIAYGRDMKVSSDLDEAFQKYGVRIGNNMDVYYHVLYSRLTDKHGLASKVATRKFLKWADEFNPDILWLHNIHGYYINYEMLFEWIKTRPQMQVKWTLHDCWSFTGHCAFFTYAQCEKWKSGCENCPQLSMYPKSERDNSKDNYNRKKSSFTGVQNLSIVTPSNWLKDEVKKSFLSEYPVEVVYNNINTEIFRKIPGDFRKRYKLEDKKIILGVANDWDKRKGLDTFVELSKKLENIDKDYQIVLVGLSEKQIQELAKDNIKILALPRTASATELAQIYSTADVFVNPTLEDNYPTVNLEAEACGTRVITYDTGGCRETIRMESSVVIPHGVDNIIKALQETH